ncbi:MAG: cyanophycinase [bacterium]
MTTRSRYSFVSIFLAALILLLMGCDPSPVSSGSEEAEEPAGHLVVVGGGGTPPSVVARALELAGGPSARVSVLPQASSREEAGEGTVEMFMEAGGVDAAVVRLDTLEGALDRLRSSDLIWMPGGSQNRFMEAVRETPVPSVMRQRYREGAVVGGTSAGAAVQSGRMITGDADLEAIRAGATETVAGLGLWAEVIVDQHFLARQRISRLFAAVLDHPDLLGIGIDERTAVVRGPGSFEVMGEGAVMVIDAREATVPVTETGAPYAARRVEVHLLREGEGWSAGG